jgi:hypothetical protein
VCLLVPGIPLAAGAQAAGGWSAQVMSAARLHEVTYISGAIPPPLEEGKIWVNVTVKVTSPGKDGTVPAEMIRLSDGAEGSYPLIGITYLAKPDHTPIYRILVGQPFPDSDRTTQARKDPAKKETGQKGPPLRPSGMWSTIYTMADDKKSVKPSGSGFFEDGNPKKLLLIAGKDSKTDVNRISFSKSPLTVVLLFQVPAQAQGLQLHLGDAAPVPVTVAP